MKTLLLLFVTALLLFSCEKDIKESDSKASNVQTTETTPTAEELKQLDEARAAAIEAEQRKSDAIEKRRDVSGN